MKKAAEAIPNTRLSREREQRGWSQQELADQLGTTPVNVSRWERGLTTPSPYFRHKLCDLFGKTARELGLVEDTTGSRSEQAPAGTLPEPATAPVPGTTLLWSVPHRRNPFFTGREDVLERLHETLTTSRAAALTQPQAITGLGGIGKTQTALEYAYRYRNEYQAVFWVRADTRETLVSDLAAIADLLHLAGANEQDQSRVVEAVQRWLSEHDGWLLILDNADDLELASEFLPTTGSGHILLTTRAQATGLLAQRIELEQMEPEEGALFLLRRAKLLGRDAPLDSASYAEWTQAKAIAGLLGGLPLALDQAGAYIEETACGLEGYLKRYQQRRAALLQRRGRLASEHPEPVATTWALSFEKVEQANPAAVELLQVCAFLHPDAIPEELLSKGAAELGPVLAPVAADPLELDAVIEVLRRYSLVRRSLDTNTLAIHRLVQAVIIDAMEEQSRRLWAERVVRAVNVVFSQEETPSRAYYDLFLPHAMVCAGLIEQYGFSFPEAAHLLHAAGDYLYSHHEHVQAESLLKQALSLRQQSLGAEHPDTARTLNLLANLYMYNGEYQQAELLVQTALATYEHVWGAAHPQIADALNVLGNIYLYTGRHAQAETLLRRALSIQEQVSGPTDLLLAEVLHSLATLSFYQGKYAQAELFYQRVLAIVEQAMGPEHPDTLVILTNLAHLFYEEGKYQQAEALLQRTLTLREQALGPEHPDLLHSLLHLGRLYTLQGRYQQAEALLQRTLALSERLLGPENDWTLRAVLYLASLAQAQHQDARAEALYRRALSGFEQALGPAHPRVAETLVGLALLFTSQGGYTQARPLLERAIAIDEHTLGSEHPQTAAALDALGYLALLEGEKEQAETLLQRALSIREQVLGPDHPEVAKSLELYARLLRATGRQDEAAQLDARARGGGATSTATP
jgi:tetratricopeptide (TPR) repeat protein/DNA-binding XRE family transcriptional regulator